MSKAKRMKPKPKRNFRLNIKKVIASAMLMSMIITLVGAATAGLYPPRVTAESYEPEAVIASTEPEIVVEETITPTVEAVEASEVYINKYTTTSLNIRKGPGTEYEIAKVVGINTELQVLEGSEADNWVIIKLNEEKYYVNSKYLSNEKTVVKTTSRSAVQDRPSTTAAGDCVGYYTLTYYCSCAKCCGKTNGITAWGTKATAGRTIATSKQFAFGTKLIINGHEYVVEDRGGAIQGNKIDVYVSSHSEALKLGVKKNVPVYIGK